MLCLVLGFLLSQAEPSTASSPCPGEQFYHENKCQDCSTCPRNEIIKVPCSEYSDLVCGPFYDPAVIPHTEPTGPEDREFPAATVEHETREDWKTLAFVLIGLLSFLIIVATLVVLVACRKLQQASRGKPLDDADIEDPDSGYVVIHAIRSVGDCSPTTGRPSDPPPLLGQEDVMVPRAGRLRFLPRVYKPRRWLLNYDADDVFESEDSAGSTRLPPYKLTTISEKSDEKSEHHKSDDSLKEKSDHTPSTDSGGKGIHSNMNSNGL